LNQTFEVVEELRQTGAELVTVADGLTLDGPAAEITLAVIAWAAKMERFAINERIAAARQSPDPPGLKLPSPHSRTTTS
jgi:DNA invertase Pin-like site-specific DNA recombinase